MTSRSCRTHGAFGEWKLLLSVELVQCLMNTQHFFPWQDATQESVPIMLVGNKADLHDAAAAEEQKCVPGYLGEKLAMVRVKWGYWDRALQLATLHSHLRSLNKVL